MKNNMQNILLKICKEQIFLYRLGLLIFAFSLKIKTSQKNHQVQNDLCINSKLIFCIIQVPDFKLNLDEISSPSAQKESKEPAKPTTSAENSAETLVQKQDQVRERLIYSYSDGFQIYIFIIGLQDRYNDIFI